MRAGNEGNAYYEMKQGVAIGSLAAHESDCHCCEFRNHLEETKTQS